MLNLDQIKDVLVNQYEHIGSYRLVAQEILDGIKGVNEDLANSVFSMSKEWEKEENVRYSMNKDVKNAEIELEAFIRRHVGKFLSG